MHGLPIITSGRATMRAGSFIRRCYTLLRRRFLHPLYIVGKCKAMAESTLSSKNQIVIPREAREALGVKAGDKLKVVVRGDRVIVLQRPDAYHDAIRGLAKRTYRAGFLQKERQSWR
jgi:AbrB family looped-hinge helix DNA binding protein